ncbi:MAG: metallophosphoesterase [Janthinobacterium lividum]
MNFFVIADIHGCMHTFSELLTHWRPSEELLVQLGDLVDRGNFSPETVEMCRQLNLDFPEHTVFLKGNHDWGMAEHLGLDGPYPMWLEWGGKGTLRQYQRQRPLLMKHATWLNNRPLFWENEHVKFSHAGFGGDPEPFAPLNEDGVLWRRKPLLNTGQLQVVGHTPTADGKLRFDRFSNAIYLDTGAVFGRCLTGLRLSETGEVLGTVVVPTHRKDID